MLEGINNTADLRKLSVNELDALAQEIRTEIIDTVSKHGGHLSSNLGMVELTIALDYVFDCDKDRLIFDVGHQTYAHKLLTGRRGIFSTLRQKDGMCGFTSMSEDARDAYTSGHASTSISAALAYCRARDLMGGHNSVVAVVGDGALTGGLSFEALNDAGENHSGLIVVLNDNEMSISHNVGALSDHLTSMRQTHFYRNFKAGTRSFLRRIPLIGKPLFRIIEALRDMIKGLVLGDNVFDSLGFMYVGPIDGHNIKRMIKALNKAKEIDAPVLIHVVTKKGKGYKPAEEKPDIYHGPSPFNIETGDFVKPESERNGVLAAEKLVDSARSRKDICVICAAMPTGTGMSVFSSAYPERFFDVGIAEEHAVTMAGGLAAAGMKPYVCLYSTFLQRAYDQISNDCCINALPVTFLIDRAGLVGSDGVTHNGTFDISFLRSIPNMTIAAPRDKHALMRLMDFSLTFDKPLAIRYQKDSTDLGKGFQRSEKICAGKWERLLEGNDITILTVGSLAATALSVSVTLNSRNISVGVIDAMFIKPMDIDTLLREARMRKLIVTLEDNTLLGGFGEAVCGELMRAGVHTNVLTLGINDEYVPHASVSQQLEMCGLDNASVANRIIEKFYETNEPLR